MKLFMASVNYKNNSLSQREKLSFTSEKIEDICGNICALNDICGCVIISTCNRTEIYITSESLNENNADKILLKYSGVDDFDGFFEKKENNEAVRYIMQLACGLKSQIVGEEQIVSQINSAIEISRKNGAGNSVLNTLFRIAVSAGKYTITNAKAGNNHLSASYKAVELLIKRYGNIKGKKCVIIGNGKMGQIAQRLLIKKGCYVFVTLRSYKNGNNEIVKGCKAIKYNERYDYINGADFIVSATKSPHYTLTYDRLKCIKNIPEIIIDLAVPRDVEPEISSICQCINIDELGFKESSNSGRFLKVYNIAEKFSGDFFQWENYMMSLNGIESLKDIISKRIIKGEIKYENEKNVEKIIENVVGKTVDTILGSMKEYVCPEMINKAKKKIEERARL